MKIQISFEFREKIRSVFNENTDQFCVLKKTRSESTDQFNFLKKKSDLKIQINLALKKIISENTNQFSVFIKKF